MMTKHRKDKPAVDTRSNARLIAALEEAQKAEDAIKTLLAARLLPGYCGLCRHNKPEGECTHLDSCFAELRARYDRLPSRYAVYTAGEETPND